MSYFATVIGGMPVAERMYEAYIEGESELSYLGEVDCKELVQLKQGFNFLLPTGSHVGK